MMGSIDDDYRSVIDDLTIENKKLKRRLRNYERLHCSHLQQEKLFEVRAHGLPAHKKWQLEMVLRKFAASLDDLKAGPAASAHTHKQRYSVSTANPVTSSRTPLDSAYASNCTSDIIAQLCHLSDCKSRERPLSSADARSEDVTLYTQHMPPAVVPTRPSELSDKTKKEMIVRRLKQVFTGKSAARCRPSSSQQQQEVSMSAPTMYDYVGEAQPCMITPEGSREARMLPGDHDSLDSICGHRRGKGSHDELLAISTTLSKEGTPDQRPTRPVDLDMYRPQVGAENLDYIRHLGLASPVECSDLPDDGKGWVYLNLLSSMAQLHTFSVTSNFIRTAIAETNTGFELSPDGQQVRWRGTPQVVSGDSEIGHGSRRFDSEGPVSSFEITNTRAAAQSYKNNMRAIRRQETIDAGQPEYAGSLDHGRLCINGTRPRANYCSNNSISSEPLEPCKAREPGHLSIFKDLHPSNHTAVTSTNHNGNGPVIFYKQAAFCTDLSGHTQTAPDYYPSYARFSDQALGQCPSIPDLEKAGTERSEKVVRRLTTLPLLSTVTESVAISGTRFDFHDIESTRHVDTDEIEPVSFEASGLAGIQPEDNFMVNVAIQRIRPSESTTRSMSSSCLRSDNYQGLANHNLSSRPMRTLAELVTNKPSVEQSQTQDQVLFTKTTNLPPSSLPEPSYICLPFSSSDSDDGSDESESVSEASEASDEGAASEWQCSVDDDDEILPSGHLSVSISQGREIQRQLNASGDNEGSDESIDLLAYARSR